MDRSEVLAKIETTCKRLRAQCTGHIDLKSIDRTNMHLFLKTAKNAFSTSAEKILVGMYKPVMGIVDEVLEVGPYTEEHCSKCSKHVCCKQMVAVTHTEAAAIVNLLRRDKHKKMWWKRVRTTRQRLLRQFGRKPYMDMDKVKEWYRDGFCVFYKDGKCGVYEARPLQCRNKFSQTESQCGDGEVAQMKLGDFGTVFHKLGADILGQCSDVVGELTDMVYKYKNKRLDMYWGNGPLESVEINLSRPERGIAELYKKVDEAEAADKAEIVKTDNVEEVAYEDQ